MDISTLNWLAVIVAAISTFLIGFLWYSPILFGKAWMKANGLTDAEIQKGNMAKIFGFAFLWTFVMAVNLAMFLNAPDTDYSWGAIAGFLSGFGFVSMGIFVIGLFERRSTTYMLINAGYMTVSFVVMGLIIGLWR